MSLPYSEGILDAITTARMMSREEGKQLPTVVLLHPFVMDPWLSEIGVGQEEMEPQEGRDPAPMIAGLRLVRDETIPVDEVCCLNDADYMEHERAKAEAARPDDKGDGR